MASFNLNGPKLSRVNNLYFVVHRNNRVIYVDCNSFIMVIKDGFMRRSIGLINPTADDKMINYRAEIVPLDVEYYCCCSLKRPCVCLRQRIYVYVCILFVRPSVHVQITNITLLPTNCHLIIINARPCNLINCQLSKLPQFLFIRRAIVYYLLWCIVYPLIIKRSIVKRFLRKLIVNKREN